MMHHAFYLLTVPSCNLLQKTAASMWHPTPYLDSQVRSSCYCKLPAYVSELHAGGVPLTSSLPQARAIAKSRRYELSLQSIGRLPGVSLAWASGAVSERPQIRITKRASEGLQTPRKKLRGPKAAAQSGPEDPPYAAHPRSILRKYQFEL